MSSKQKDPDYAYKRAFGRRLRACREVAGYDTIDPYRKKLGLEYETYRTYEAGIRQPPFHVLAKISDLTGKSLDFLILGKNDEP